MSTPVNRNELGELPGLTRSRHSSVMPRSHLTGQMVRLSSFAGRLIRILPVNCISVKCSFYKASAFARSLNLSRRRAMCLSLMAALTNLSVAAASKSSLIKVPACLNIISILGAATLL